MSDLIHNERLKIRANLFNSAASSAFAVGVLAPIAAVFYSIGGSQPPPLPSIIIGTLVWVFLAFVLHLTAIWILGGLKP